MRRAFFGNRPAKRRKRRPRREKSEFQGSESFRSHMGSRLSMDGPQRFPTRWCRKYSVKATVGCKSRSREHLARPADRRDAFVGLASRVALHPEGRSAVQVRSELRPKSRPSLIYSELNVRSVAQRRACLAAIKRSADRRDHRHRRSLNPARHGLTVSGTRCSENPDCKK